MLKAQRLRMQMAVKGSEQRLRQSHREAMMLSATAPSRRGELEMEAGRQRREFPLVRDPHNKIVEHPHRQEQVTAPQPKVLFPAGHRRVQRKQELR